MALVKKKVAAGKTTEILSVEEAAEAPASAQILDLTELLKRSLKKGSATVAPKISSSKVTSLTLKNAIAKSKPTTPSVKTIAKTKAKTRGAKG